MDVEYIKPSTMSIFPATFNSSPHLIAATIAATIY